MGKTVLDNISSLRFSEEMTWQQLLSKMSDEAIKNGWAKEGFKDALLTREEKFATGLHASIDIAIPHADAEWTIEPAMVAATLDTPVPFNPMGGEGGMVQAQFVFMLVIPDADAHLDFLQAIAGFIEDEELLGDLAETKDITKLISYLKENM